MPKIHIERKIEVGTSPREIFAVLVDFKQWSSWSPWLVLEKDCQLEFAPDGSSYTWNGKRIGAGSMKVKNKDYPSKIVYDLVFLKPYRSKAIITFDIRKTKNGSEIYLVMDSSLPFYLGWMKKPLQAGLIADYDRGLLMLKDFLEQGEVASVLHEEGISAYTGCLYVGSSSECPLDNMSETMSQDMKELSYWVDDEELDIQGEPITIYHKIDRVNNLCAFTVAIPVEEIPEDLPAPFHGGKIPRLKAFKLIHEGPYRHLPNAWALGEVMSRNKEIVRISGYPPFEVYLSDPQDTADELLETEVYFPVKS